MKKKLFLALFVGMFSFGYCQNVDVRINNQNATTGDECPFRINGICITEDIGGVDAEFKNHHMTLTNYNSFPVTVTWQFTYHNPGSCCSSLDGTTKKGSTVIGAQGSKSVPTDDICCDDGWVLDGLIARQIKY